MYSALGGSGPRFGRRSTRAGFSAEAPFKRAREQAFDAGALLNVSI